MQCVTLTPKKEGVFSGYSDPTKRVLTLSIRFIIGYYPDKDTGGTQIITTIATYIVDETPEQVKLKIRQAKSGG